MARHLDSGFVNDLKPNQKFADVGIDSICVIGVVSELERELDIAISEEEFATVCNSIGSMTRLLQQLVAQKRMNDHTP